MGGGCRAPAGFELARSQRVVAACRHSPPISLAENRLCVDAEPGSVYLGSGVARVWLHLAVKLCRLPHLSRSTALSDGFRD